ncbi:MAG TPA: hypothetical protein VJU61_14355, partial [Polyangiaceae bacterium]|nr:hypothetical protein [Polyangiaceae bacterium]
YGAHFDGAVESTYTNAERWLLVRCLRQASSPLPRPSDHTLSEHTSGLDSKGLSSQGLAATPVRLSP